MTVRIPRWFVIPVVAIVVVGGIGFGSFALGRSIGRRSIDKSAIRRAGYGAGYSAGTSSGWANGNATGRQTGYDAGKQAGYTNGYNAAVKKANPAIGNAFSSGANAAFAGYSVWDIGHYYIVLIGAGSGGATYDMPSRLEMTPGQSYNLCATSNGICGGAIP